MTSEQKKAIDACKDQAAKEFDYESFPRLIEFVGNDPGSAKEVATIMTRAMQLYGEQCKPKWIPSTTLPESGRHVLLHCKGEGVTKPSGEPKTFICTGFYTASRQTECWVDDYDPKTCTGVEDIDECLYLSPGWYVEHEQHRGDTDYHFFQRDVIEWMPLPEIKKLTAQA